MKIRCPHCLENVNTIPAVITPGEDATAVVQCLNPQCGWSGRVLFTVAAYQPADTAGESPRG